MSMRAILRLSCVLVGLIGAPWAFAKETDRAADPAKLESCRARHAKRRARCQTLEGEARGKCIQSVVRRARNCRRVAEGQTPIDWKAFDACGAAHLKAVTAAGCERAPSLRRCLRPFARTLTDCHRAARSERPIDWVAWDACVAARVLCEVPCGRESTSTAAQCRRGCFATERACRAKLARPE
jgi:hypothetical protein